MATTWTVSSSSMLAFILFLRLRMYSIACALLVVTCDVTWAAEPLSLWLLPALLPACVCSGRVTVAAVVIVTCDVACLARHQREHRSCLWRCDCIRHTERCRKDTLQSAVSAGWSIVSRFGGIISNCLHYECSRLHGGHPREGTR